MKHVFVIHSHTVFLSACGAIEILHLKENEVIFLYARNYQISCVNIPYVIYNVDDLYYYQKSKIFYTVNPFCRMKHQRMVDEFIENNINEDYFLYIPHTGFPFFQILLTNSKCKGLNLLQEAAVSYFKKKYKLKTLLKNLLSVGDRRYWHQSNWFIPNRFYREKECVRTFAFTERYFSPLVKALAFQVKMPKFSIDINIDSQKPIFVFEAAIELNFIEREIFMQGCALMIDECKAEINYVKFHPNQKEENKKDILSFFGNSKVNELPMDIPFEIILSTYSDLNVYGFTTSLIYYAEQMGHNTKSYADYLTSKSKRFANYVNRMSK